MTEDAPDLYRAIGGADTCLRLSAAFYARVDNEPSLRPLFPGKSKRCAVEAFAAFLAQFLGGPTEDARHRWWLSLRESHLRFKIGPAERAAWMRQLVLALDEVQIDEPFRTALRELFEQSSAYLAHTESECDTLHPELAWRWTAQRQLDDAVAAVRSGDAQRAIALAEASTAHNRSLLAGLLAVMMGSRNDAIQRYVHDKISADPTIVQETYADRTLLHEASANGILTLVELLLSLGADPGATDGGGHTPLYTVANECTTAEGASVVRALVARGADVNAKGGVTRCTPLHMAARRGSVEIAQALLECGADLAARDTKGDTPLRRALNCKKPQVAAVLAARRG